MLIRILLLTLLSGCSSTPYIETGVGYKFREQKIDWVDGSKTHPVSGFIEVGLEFDGVEVGIAHHSQPFTGKPFNDNEEYAKTELFISKRWEF